MLTILIAVVAGVLVGWAAMAAWGFWWSIICGVAVVIGIQVGIGFLLRRRIGAVQSALQQKIAEGQGKLQRRIQILQQKPMSNLKAAQQMLEQEQAKLIRAALADLDKFKPYYLWSPMLKRQISTMRMAFHYQLREFDQVDALMKDCLFYDPQSIAMKLARMYKKDDPKLDRFFKARSRRVKGDACALVYGTYAWIKLKQEKPEAATAVMIEAKGKSTHPVVVENWERLMNNKHKHFSLAGLGDQWYALFLEEPKMRQQRMVKQYN